MDTTVQRESNIEIYKYDTNNFLLHTPENAIEYLAQIDKIKYNLSKQQNKYNLITCTCIILITLIGLVFFDFITAVK